MGAIAIHLSRAGPAGCDVVQRMLVAAPHRGSDRAIQQIGQVAIGVANDPNWTTATVARGENRLAGFCGALDNAEELRGILRREGSRVDDARTPAAILLAGFDRWGEDVVEHLRGSFAGAITDGRVVWCFRDHFGARPLFRHDGPGGFFAATEVKQVLAGAMIPREPNVEHLHKVLFGGVDTSTAYRGVERIPKTTIATIGADVGVVLRQYWDPSRYVETSKLGAREAIEGTVEALDRAVTRQLSGCDVILLSGGLDSPALAVFAGRAASEDRPVRALTARYPAYPSVDEIEWTRMAADHVGLPLHSFVADAGSLDEVEHWVKLLDGPVDIVSIPEAAEAYREARALGARTVLNGEVAEFLFECRGYLLDHLLAHARVRAASRVVSWARERGKRRRKIARDIAWAAAPDWLLRARRLRNRRPLRGVPPWLDEDRLRNSGPGPNARRAGARQRWKKMQTATLSGPGIGFEADEICAAACGVDTRRPFADVDLWEFVLSLPAETKFPSPRTKPLLRDAMRGLLPDALIDRRDKTIFNEFHLAKADYPTLRRLLSGPRHFVEGVDYALLTDRLLAAEMTARELQWARDVARIHVFLEQWA